MLTSLCRDSVKTYQLKHSKNYANIGLSAEGSLFCPNSPNAWPNSNTWNEGLNVELYMIWYFVRNSLPNKYNSQFKTIVGRRDNLMVEDGGK